jgi:hypothetical protein
MLLKKVGQTVLVGDRVRVGSMDWAQGKGQVSPELQVEGVHEDITRPMTIPFLFDISWITM